MAVSAAEVIALPSPSTEVEVDEGSSIGEVEHYGCVIQPCVFEAATCLAHVGPEAQLARLVVARPHPDSGRATGR